MRKLTIILLAAMFCLNASAQKKEAGKQPDSTVQKLVHQQTATVQGIDTLTILNTVKFVKVNGKTIPVKALEDALLIQTGKDVDQFLIAVQEFPAKFVTPFTAFFLKYYGLEQQQVPLTKPK